MAGTMTRSEAERILGLTEDYTLDELKNKRRKHMAEFHPDKFPEEPTDGKMSKAAAEREFIKGAQAFDTLSPMFSGMPADYKVTPEAKRAAEARASHVSAHTNSHTDSHADSHADFYANSYAYAYAKSYAAYASSHASHGTGSGTTGTTGYANADRSADTGGTAAGTDQHGSSYAYGYEPHAASTATSSEAGQGSSKSKKSNKARGGKTKKAHNSHADDVPYSPYTNQAAWANQTAQATTTSQTATTAYAATAAAGKAAKDAPIRHMGGPLFWCLVVFGVIAILFWNQADPKGAFVSVVQFIFDPSKMFLLLVGLGFVYVKGW